MNGGSLKILMVHGYGLEGSGSSIYARNLAASFVRAGHVVRLLAHTGHGDSAVVQTVEATGVAIERLPPQTLAVTYPRAEFPKAPLIRRMSELELRRLSRAVAATVASCADAFGADLVVVNHFLPVAHGATTGAAALQIPSVVISHGTDIEYACAVSEAANTLGVETFRQATYRIALNGIAQRRIAEVLQQECCDIAVVPPGIDIDTFVGSVATSRDCRAVQVGRLLLDKGQQVSIAALCMALPEFPNLELVLVGDGPDREGLERMVQAIDEGKIDEAQRGFVDMGTTPHRAQLLSSAAYAMFSTRGRIALRSLKGRLKGAVQFAGYRSSSEVSEILRSARLALLPSLVPECYPLTLLEALASGCYIQASPLGGTAEVLQTVSSISNEAAASREISPERPVLSLLNGMRSALPKWKDSCSRDLSASVRASHDWGAVTTQLVSIVSAGNETSAIAPGR